MIKIKLVQVMTKCKINQQVASSSSQPSDQSNASNRVQVLQPTNIARDHPLDSIIGDIRPREVIDVEDDKNQVLSNSNVQASGSQDQSQASASVDKVQDQQQVASSSSQPNDQSNASNQMQVLQPTNVTRDHPLDSIIGNISRGVQTRFRLASFCEHFSFVSSIEPKKIDEALKDVDWVNAMHESSMGVGGKTKGTQYDWNQMGL